MLDVYIPMDRRRAIAQGRDLPDRADGAVLFADISGFTPLTTALLRELGLSRGPEELTRQLNRVYDTLVSAVHRYGGSVLGFAGDAITCWFNRDDGSAAVACGLAMQQAMGRFATIETPTGTPISLGMKAAVAAGPVRRFLVGDHSLQIVDVLAGATLDRMAAAEHQAERGEVVVAPELVAKLDGLLTLSARRIDSDTGLEFAVVSGLTRPVAEAPWPPLSPEQRLGDAQAKAWLLRPVFDRLTSGQGQFLAEIRPAVALFLRFGGIDYDADDEAGAKLDAYIRWVQRVLARYEGSLLQLTIGDKGCYLYAAFGAPITHGDDPARAVAAALALQMPPPALEFVGPVQTGISQGRMRTGAYGGQARRTYGVLGDEVNMAARLMGRARPGQIMVSGRVAQAIRSNYAVDDLGLVQVKGKDEPIPVALVRGRRRYPARRPVDLYPTPLVGRDAELTQLAQILTTAEIESGQIVSLQGPAGIGKSHLTVEFSRQALNQGWRVTLGACQSTTQDIPYRPWRQIFRAMFVLLDESGPSEEQTATAARHIEQVTITLESIDPGWLVRLPLLGDLLDLPIPDNPTTAAFEPQLRQEALFTLAVDLLQYWARAQPLLIMLEDSHWLDETSQALALALALVAGQVPLVLMVVQRPPLDSDQPLLPNLARLPNHHFFDLAELSPAGVAAITSHRLKAPPSALLLSLVQHQTQGNPFYVEELLDALLELGHLSQTAPSPETGPVRWDLSRPLIDTLRQAGGLTHDSQGRLVLRPNAPLPAAELGLPDSIQGLVLARLDRMPEAHKLTLKVASVIGRMFPFKLLWQAHPAKPDEAALLQQVAELERREFARLETPLPQLSHIFKHNITRDVAYGSLLERQQRVLHRAVGGALEVLLPDAIEQLAYHFSQARVRDKSILYLDQAARKAQRDYANETALGYYDQALALDTRWQWLAGKIEVLHILGRRETELNSLRRLEALPAAPPFVVTYLWGQYFEAIADFMPAEAAFEKATAIARQQTDPLGEARCLSQLALIARRRGDYERARTMYMKVLTVFPVQESYPAKEGQVLVQALNGLGVTLRQQGNFEQAKLYYNWALTLSQNSGDSRGEAQALDNLGTISFHQRDLTQAKTFHQQALELRQVIGNRAGEGTSLFNLALAVRDKGDYDQAARYFSEALAIQQSTGNRWEEINVRLSWGILSQELGDYAEAENSFEHALHLSREIGDEAGEAFVLCNLGLLSYDRSDLIAAGQQLNNSLALARAQADTDLESSCLSYLSQVSLQAGQLDQAEHLAQAALTLRYQLDLPLLTADDLATLAAVHLLAGREAAALETTEQLLSILEECGGEGPEFPQRAYFVCYQVLTAAGQVDQAQNALHVAHKIVTARAAKISDPALRQSFLKNVAVNREIAEAYRKDA